LQGKAVRKIWHAASPPLQPERVNPDRLEVDKYSTQRGNSEYAGRAHRFLIKFGFIALLVALYTASREKRQIKKRFSVFLA